MNVETREASTERYLVLYDDELSCRQKKANGTIFSGLDYNGQN